MSNQREIDFEPTIKQDLAFQYLTDDITTDIGYGGAAYGGKSFLGVFWVFTMCMQYPGVRYLIGRRELSTLKKTTLNTYFKMLQHFGINPESIQSFDRQLGVIKYNNTSELILADLIYRPSDPLYTRLGGLELTGGFIDESNEIDAQAIQIVQSRVGRQKNEQYGILGKVLETFNPSDNHVYARYWKPYKEGTLPEHTKFIQALPKDNPHVPESYIKRLQTLDEITRKRLLEGDFDYFQDDDTLFKIDDIINIFGSKDNDRDDMYISCDVARFGRDLTVVLVWRGLHVIDYKVGKITSTNDVITMVRNKMSEWGVPLSNVVVDEDGVGGGVVDGLGCHGFVGGSSQMNRDKKQIRDTNYKQNFQNLRTQCYYYLSESVRDGKIILSTKFVQIRDIIIEELRQIKYRDIGKDTKIKIVSKDTIKKSMGRSPDYADALMMRMYFEIKPEKRKPRVFTHKAI